MGTAGSTVVASASWQPWPLRRPLICRSGLIKAVQGRQDSLAFVVGHEVGHAIGRHRCAILHQ